MDVEGDFESFVASGGASSGEQPAEQSNDGEELATLADQIVKEAAGKTEEAPPVEQKTEEVPKEEPKVEAPKASERAEAFKRATQQEKARLEEKKAASELRQVREELAKYKSREERLKTDPLGALEEDYQVPYSKITDAHIQRLDKDPVDPELKSLKQRLTAAENELASRRVEAEEATRKATLAQYDATISEQIAKSSDLTFLPEYGNEGVELVREIVAAHFAATAVKDEAGNIVEPGEVMPESEAIKLAETHYTKIAQKLEAAKAKKAPKPPEKPQPETKPKPTTLSADMQRSAQQQPLTAADELAEQLEWLKQQGAAM